MNVENPISSRSSPLRKLLSENFNTTFKEGKCPQKEPWDNGICSPSLKFTNRKEKLAMDPFKSMLIKRTVKSTNSTISHNSSSMKWKTLLMQKSRRMKGKERIVRGHFWEKVKVILKFGLKNWLRQISAILKSYLSLKWWITECQLSKGQWTKDPQHRWHESQTYQTPSVITILKMTCTKHQISTEKIKCSKT